MSENTSRRTVYPLSALGAHLIQPAQTFNNSPFQLSTSFKKILSYFFCFYNISVAKVPDLGYHYSMEEKIYGIINKELVCGSLK